MLYLRKSLELLIVLLYISSNISFCNTILPAELRSYKVFNETSHGNDLRSFLANRQRLKKGKLFYEISDTHAYIKYYSMIKAPDNFYVVCSMEMTLSSMSQMIELSNISFALAYGCDNRRMDYKKGRLDWCTQTKALVGPMNENENYMLPCIKEFLSE